MNKISRKTHNLNATDQSVGRLATQIANVLRGKNKPEYQPHIDAGDIAKVTNVNKLRFTGKKLDQKNYYSHSGYPGGLKTIKMKKIFQKNPGEVLKKAVFKMIPNNKLRKNIIKRLIIE